MIFTLSVKFKKIRTPPCGGSFNLLSLVSVIIVQSKEVCFAVMARKRLVGKEISIFGDSIDIYAT